MKLVILTVVAFVCGCASSKHEAPLPGGVIEALPQETAYIIAHYSTEIVLTKQQPRNERFGFELKEIEPDGRVTIFVRATGALATARVGEYFVAEGFGRRGLELTAVDVDAHSATFVRRWAEQREEKIDTDPNKPVQSNAVGAPRNSGAVTAILRSPRRV